MKQNRRIRHFRAAAWGFFIAVLITLLGMAVLTLVVWKLDISDGALVLVNQLLKIGAVALGTFAAVGRGGEAGFITGAIIGTLYMAVGCGLYTALGGPSGVGSFLGEWLTGAASGALTGAIAANLPAARPRSRHAAR